MKNLSEFQIAQLIDQTNLNPLLSYGEYINFFEESKRFNFASVAILPLFTKLAVKTLKNSNTRVGAAISYPLSGVSGYLKAAEVEIAVKDGADEIDYVVNQCAIKSRDYQKVYNEARMIVEAAKGRTVKAIIEMWNLTEDEIKHTCDAVIEGKVSFVKSSTAFKGHRNMRGSTLKDALLLKEIIQDRAKIKIAGGIRTLDLTLDLLSAGVDRIGTSSGVQILSEFRNRH